MPKTRAEMRRRRKRRQRLRSIAALACVAVLLIGCGILATQIVRETRRAKTLDSVKAMYGGASAYAEDSPVTPQPEVTQTPPEPTAAPQPTATPEPQLQADFTDLYAQNPHLVAWLEAGSAISLPVVQYDNEFYLNHDFYGKSDAAGTLFLNASNSLWPQDQHLLIHGHNMKDGSMFAPLAKYREPDWLRQNPIVYLRSIYDEQPVPYVIISVFDASMEEGAVGYFDLGRINFDTDEQFLAFAQELQDASLFDVPVDVQAGDCLLSLVTCSYIHDDGRLTVACRKLRDDETVEDVAALMQQAVRREAH